MGTTVPQTTRPRPHPSAAPRRRLPRREDATGALVNVVLLTAVWLLLLGRVTALSVLSGLVLAALIGVLFPMPAIRWSGRLRPLGLLRLAGAVLWDLARASVELAVLALDPRRRPRPGVVAVHLSSDSDLHQVATGTVLSIVPGSVVVEARRRTRTLYMHVVDMGADEAGEHRRAGQLAELRILRAFGTRAEIERAERAMRSGTDGAGRTCAAAGRAPHALARAAEVRP